MDLYHLEADAVIRQYQPLIHKVLHQLHIRKSHCQYEDYHQELNIKLIEAAQIFQGSPLLAENQPRFIGLAYKLLYWRLIDLIRKAQCGPDTVSYEQLADYEISGRPPAPAAESSLAIQTFIALAQAKLSTEEFGFMLVVIADQHTVTGLSELFGVSRATIYNWKAKLEQKLADLKIYLRE